MQAQTVRDFLFQMYDYADFLADKIGPDNNDSSTYFVSMVYIEDMMDTYGRSLAYHMAQQAGQEEAERTLQEAHRRIDLLRERINNLCKQYNFDEALREHTRGLLRDWTRSHE